jgi:HEAT repeat protein
MNAIALLLCLLAPQDGPFSDKDAEDALRKLKADFDGASIEKRVAAVQEALKIGHEKVIRAMSDILAKEPSPVRAAAAKALADVDHPASADVLVKAMAANQGRPEVMPEILKALGDLGYQSACPALHEYVRKVGDPDIRNIMPEVLAVLGDLGSLASVDPLVDLLQKMEGGRRAWVNEVGIRGAADRALQAILGQNFNRALDWNNYWRQNEAFLKAGLTRTYWLRKTQQRTDAAPFDKTPADAVLVCARLHPPPQAQGQEDENKKRAARRRRDR